MKLIKTTKLQKIYQGQKSGYFATSDLIPYNKIFKNNKHRPSSAQLICHILVITSLHNNFWYLLIISYN